MADITLTKKEQKAIERLQKVADTFPETLVLFSWSGSLMVMKRGQDERLCVIEEIYGIENDGGDPSDEEVEQHPEIEYL